METILSVQKWQPVVKNFSNHWWWSKHVRKAAELDIEKPPEGWTFAMHDFKELGPCYLS